MAATQPPSITPAPTPAPQRGQKATFSARVDGFVTWLTAAVGQFGAVATNVFNNAVDAFNNATAAAQSASQAAQQAGYALASATSAADSVNAAAAAVGASMWVSGTTYQQYALAVSKIPPFRTYRKLTTAASNTGGAADPASDPVNWAPVGAATLPRSPRTANTTLVQKDMGSLVDVSGTFTQLFDAVGNLGPGWYCYIRNSGTGDVTLDASGTETIDGLTSFVMYPGESRLVQCDGTALRSIVVTPFYKVVTATANFIKPPGYNYFGGNLWAGGASGPLVLVSTTATAGGGGGGAGTPFLIPASMVAASELVTIGAGGLANDASSSSVISLPGNPGGASSFAGITASGGLGGQTSTTATSSGGAGGFTNNPNGTGGGTGGLALYNNPASNGTGSFYGGGGGGGSTYGYGNTAGGASVLGGKGGDGITGDSTTKLVAGAGVVPGGGGGAATVRNSSGSASGASGPGARGEVRIWGIA